MSWEEIGVSQACCPCGQGKITQKHYIDDWNRSKDGQLAIECEDCARKYGVETIHHHSRLSTDGGWDEFFLVPKGYPDYTGLSEMDTYGPTVSSNYNFVNWLIEHFTTEELLNAKVQLLHNKSSAKLTGIAADIRNEHRRAKNTVRIGKILGSVEEALEAYSEYTGNKSQREDVRTREKEARNAYGKEKRKYTIKVKFD